MDQEIYVNMTLNENEKWECLSISTKPTTELSMKVELATRVGFDKNDNEDADYKEYAISPVCVNPILWKELTQEPSILEDIVKLVANFIQENYINILEV